MRDLACLSYDVGFFFGNRNAKPLSARSDRGLGGVLAHCGAGLQSEGPCGLQPVAQGRHPPVPGLVNYRIYRE